MHSDAYLSNRVCRVLPSRARAGSAHGARAVVRVGRCVVTDDLVAALRSGHLAGAGLDVADPEPLPPDHPLWSMPNVLITPHVAIYGTPYRDKWEAMLIENCRPG